MKRKNTYTQRRDRRSTPHPLKGKQGTLHLKTKPTSREDEPSLLPQKQIQERKKPDISVQRHPSKTPPQ